jgi:RsiW-degrading membrane proteinase PrsW (M82 family)
MILVGATIFHYHNHTTTDMKVFVISCAVHFIYNILGADIVTMLVKVFGIVFFGSPLCMSATIRCIVPTPDDD